MQDLRLVAANESGSHLVLRSPDGDKFVVPIDERLRAAIRGDKTLLSQLDVGDGQLRPKEIQARIRSGESAEQVARAAGIHVDRVRRFEGPVLAEREHMAQMSQRAAVRRPGQAELRPNTLGESLPPQLAELGLTVADTSWDSWRRDDNRWVVQVEYPHDGLTQQAKFLFDPRARTAVAENEQARFLTGELAEHPARAPFKPRIATALPTGAQSQPDLDEMDDEDEIQPSALVRRPDPTTNRRPVDVVARRPEAVPAHSAAPRPATLVTPPAPAPMVVPPMPAPAVAQASVPQPAPRRVVVDTPTLPLEAPVPVSLPVEAEHAMPARRTGTHDASVDEVRPPTPSPSPSRSSGRRRASVPSWDDILIGTRPKD